MTDTRSDAQLIVEYDKVRTRRNLALDELKPLHAELLTRARASNGVVQTKKGYASISFETRHDKDKKKIEELVADGTIHVEIERTEKLTVVAT